MKFLMICSYFPSVINFRGKLLEAIANQGYEVHVIAPDLADYSQDQQTLNNLGYHLHQVPMQRAGTNPLQDLKTLNALYHCIKTIQPDVVLAYTIKPVIYGMLAATLAKVRQRFALITGLGYAFSGVEEGRKISTFQKIVYGLYRRALKHSHKVFFQNPDDQALFQKLKLLNAYTPTVVVNGSGVSVKQFDVLPLPLNAQQQPKAAFLLIARLLIDKGIREYAQAAKIIKSRYPEVEFHLVGWIDDNPTAISQEELNQWIAEDRLKFWGKLNDVRPAIAESSVYVLPSYREGTPRTVLEAMAMGRAIITTDAPGCRETVKDGENGYLVPVKSVDALVDAMTKLIEAPQLISQMGQAARHLALSKYDVEQVNTHMLQEMGVIK
ncbi:glycosyltransferase family 4 protein [Acinetobacter qingfengensis]|uniref:Glycosyl transferase n=1 Tax=Acinetobacter qingfengensis TaxID=1262585 RepID=A0A1E7RDA9_9GAMM|nr:glycosyltransferase family 4 protein [Acinetobacter qingfengensis]KAA8732075.1 glycosyltransferase family 4 protein [Acinetobacter qingfengensis]OEY97155.1 glycosyl transferase [Acinetobacter qingfengensis]